jgi:hypothetical protein
MRSMGPVSAGLAFSLSTYLRFPFVSFWIFSLGFLMCFFLSRSFSLEDQKRIAPDDFPEGNALEMEDQEETSIQVEPIPDPSEVREPTKAENQQK